MRKLHSKARGNNLSEVTEEAEMDSEYSRLTSEPAWLFFMLPRLLSLEMGIQGRAGLSFPDSKASSQTWEHTLERP